MIGKIETSAVSVKIENLSLSYGETEVLKGIDLTIEPGEFFAFLGPSGSGKSTLLRAIAGFGPVPEGRILIGEDEVTSLPPWQRNVGMVFQSYALWPHMTVGRNVAFGLEERKVPKREISERVEAALDLVGLTEPVSSSASPWRAPSSSSLGCCCWTNHYPTWMPTCAFRCAAKSWSCSASFP
jgi:ABC-type Fe3+/spermidine/putrescine transport system ATPase subunit